MKELVAYLAKTLAGRPDEVVVTETSGDRGRVLELAASEEDLHQLIGKHGRTIRAMRSLLAAAAAKSGDRFYLKIAGDSSGAGPGEGEALGETGAPEEAEPGHD